MLLLSWTSLFACLTFLSVSLAQEDSTAVAPEIEVTASFPESNPFGHIVNGEKNQIKLLVENKSDLNVTLLNVAGAIQNANTDTLIKNTTVTPLDVKLLSGVKLEFAYAFHSEFKPGDVRLNVWLNHAVGESTYRVSAYDSIVTIVEPEKSILDLKLLITYLIVIGLFGGIVYAAYVTFVPQSKKPRRKQAVASDVSTPVTATATGAGGYQEEWIPEHHLKKSKKTGVVSSDGETSGGEVSGKEARKRKVKK